MASNIHRTQALPLAALALAASSLALWLLLPAAPELPFADAGGTPRAERAYGELPLAFEPNAGRSERGVDFISRSASGTVLLGPDEATLALGHGKRAQAISLKLAGAAPARPQALERLPGIVNDLRGDDPQAWRTEIPTFERVRYPGVWSGTDLEYYGNQGRLEYDLRLAPGADPAQIAIRIAGADRLRLAGNGDLLITAGTETVRQRAPIAYQPGANSGSSRERTPVRAAFALSGDTVSFRLGRYDRRRPLVIDPLVLSYSTYLGGSDFDDSLAIAVNSAGAAYITGWTASTDFDMVGAIQGPSDSTGCSTTTCSSDVFVSKLSPDGSALRYSTYLGGDGSDIGRGIAVDSSGAPYVTGTTGFAAPGENSASHDVFVSKLTPAGSALAYSTYLGGTDDDRGFGIAVDSSGAAYVTGATWSSDFDTVGAIEGPSGGGADVFVSKLTPDGGALEYSTYLGGSNFDETAAGFLGGGGDIGRGIAVDSAGAAYVTGSTTSTDFDTVGAIEGDSRSADAFVSKLNPAGSALAYSTYLGGDGADVGNGIAVDSAGAAYTTGYTLSSDFDTVDAIQSHNHNGFDAFVSKLTPAGSALEYSTYLGGNGDDLALGIAVDTFGAAYVTGGTGAPDFPTVDPIEVNPSGAGDAFVSKLTRPGNALVYSTYLGGTNGGTQGNGIAVDPTGAAYVTGSTASTDFHTVGAIEGDSAGSDAIVSKLGFCTITGTPGDDTLVGTPGADTICGVGGDDVIVGHRGDDELRGGAGNDVLIGSRGDDALDGGSGQDRADYSADATGSVEADLVTGVVTAANLGTDTISRGAAGASTVERVRGSRFDDTLVGDGQDNELDGGDGNDTIAAAGGADILIGAGGADDLSGGHGDDRLGPGNGDDPMVSGGRDSDTLRYANVSGGGVSVDLAAGVASPLGGSNSGTDTLAADIENALGSSVHDELSAQLAGTASVLDGGDGADALDTADGDALDSARGGPGADACATDGGDQRSSCP